VLHNYNERSVHKEQGCEEDDNDVGRVETDVVCGDRFGDFREGGSWGNKRKQV
jgi:hypothetical protein